MNAGEVNMKGRISMTRTEYSVLKEVLKFHECGWSNSQNGERVSSMVIRAP
jgi:hypothetical protein